jgi:hypothetical protein
MYDPGCDWIVEDEDDFQWRIDAVYRDIDDEMAEERELMADVDDDEEEAESGNGVCYVDISTFEEEDSDERVWKW